MQMLHISLFFFFLMIRRPPRSTLDRSSAASDVYKRQLLVAGYAFDRFKSAGNAPAGLETLVLPAGRGVFAGATSKELREGCLEALSLIHISQPTRPY